jgi:hypothetical protein
MRGKTDSLEARTEASVVVMSPKLEGAADLSNAS